MSTARRTTPARATMTTPTVRSIAATPIAGGRALRRARPTRPVRNYGTIWHPLSHVPLPPMPLFGPSSHCSPFHVSMIELPQYGFVQFASQPSPSRSEEHTSELQSRLHLV